MRKVMTARIGGRYVVVPKLVGLLLVLVALLLFISSTADLIVSWDKVKDVKECLAASAGNGSTLEYLVCTVKAASIGIYPFGNHIDYMDVWSVMGQKAAVWVFWVLVLVIALVIYQSGKLLELEEEIIEAKESIQTTSKSDEKKKSTRKRKTSKK